MRESNRLHVRREAIDESFRFRKDKVDEVHVMKVYGRMEIWLHLF